MQSKRMANALQKESKSSIAGQTQTRITLTKSPLFSLTTKIRQSGVGVSVKVTNPKGFEQIETFPFSERAAADKTLAAKAEDAKKGYYLQMVKVPLEDK